MSLTPEDLPYYPELTPFTFVEPWRPVATEKYSAFVNGEREIPITKTYGRRSNFGPYKGIAISLGDQGLIMREASLGVEKHIPVSLSLPDMDHDTSFRGGYTHHTAVVMTAMLRWQERFAGAVVAEYGAGSGVLGLWALKLGARKVILLERDKNLFYQAKKLYQMHAIPQDVYDIIHDDIANVCMYEYLLQDATIGVANLGHWDDYKKWNDGKKDFIYADELAYAAIRFSGSMHTFITGGYQSELRLSSDCNEPWLDRRSSPLVGAAYSLLSHGFRTLDHLDGVASLPIFSTTHCAVAVRE